MVPPLEAPMTSPRGPFLVFIFLAGIAGGASAQESAQPAPSPAAQSAAPGSDQGAAEQQEAEESPGPKARVPWKGTALKWNQSVTTTAIGVGSDYQSSSYQVYSHGYSALLNYYLIDQEAGKLRVASSPGFDVEYTNSEETTAEREPQFRDLNLSFVGSIPYFLDSARKYVFLTSPNATVLFPTSEVSQETGTQLVTSPRLSAVVGGPLLPDVDFPKEFAVGASFRWDHRFSEATEPVNPALLDRPRQTGTGELYFSDQLSGTPFAHDTIEAGGLLSFEGLLLDQPLEFQMLASWSTQYLYTLDESACVTTTAPTCSALLSGEEPPTTRVVTTFAAEAAYYPMPEWGFSLGYVNRANQLAPNGQRRSIFYSPDAMFTTELVISLDAIYEGLTGPRRGVRFVLPG